MRIAMLDDEPLELDRLVQALEMAVMPDGSLPQLHPFTDGPSLMKRLRQDTFDLLILDWQMPEVSGLDVLQWTQAHMDAPPAVIMVTGRSEEAAVVEALTAGAADYMQKPFRPGELLARVRNALRARVPAANASPAQTFGDIVFYSGKEEATRDGVPVPLAPREYKLALLFFTHLGQPLSRQYLYDRLWTRDEEFSSRSLDTHIYRIRTKLGLTADRGWSLATVYGYGYRLTQRETSGD
jgi:two-component system response regulator TrcR